MLREVEIWAPALPSVQPPYSLRPLKSQQPLPGILARHDKADDAIGITREACPNSCKLRMLGLENGVVAAAVNKESWVNSGKEKEEDLVERQTLSSLRRTQNTTVRTALSSTSSVQH